jgi:hypothetical protein
MEYFRDFVAAPLPASDPYHRASHQLKPGDILYSATRAFRLVFQTDGNLVLYGIDDSTLPVDIAKGQYTKALWATGTNGMGAVRCEMQTDGNLVLYEANGAAVWASGTNGNPGAFLRCQDDGNLVIYLGPDAKALWSSGTYAQSHGDSMGHVISPSLTMGFSFQLNAYSPMNKTSAYQQYAIALWGNVLMGSVDNWPLTGPNIINDFFTLATLPSAEIPAGYKLKIHLDNDANGNINNAIYDVIDNLGNTKANYLLALESIGGVTSGDLAPIVAFELNIVGPVNGESAVLSSGAGNITYTAETPLTASDGLPLSVEDRDVVTEETANSFYGTLPASPSKTLTQSFRTSTAEPMMRKLGKSRPETQRR